MALGDRRWGVYKLKKDGTPYKNSDTETSTKEAAEKALDRIKNQTWAPNHEYGYRIVEMAQKNGLGPYVRIETLTKKELEEGKHPDMTVPDECACRWAYLPKAETVAEQGFQSLKDYMEARRYSYPACPGTEKLEAEVEEAREGWMNLLSSPEGHGWRAERDCVWERLKTARRLLKTHQDYAAKQRNRKEAS